MTIRGGSSVSNSSLGAVGGARGTAAGALRILVEFITQYDSGAVKQLESDLASLSAQEQTAANKTLASTRALETAERRRAQAQKDIKQLVAQSAAPGKSGVVNRQLKEIQEAGILTKLGQNRLRILDSSLGLQGKLVNLVTKEARLTNGLVGFRAQLSKRDADRLAILEQQQAVEGQLTRFQQLKSDLPKKLGGLALGAVSGVFGGALIGVGFAAAEVLLDKIESGLRDIIDPARYARDAIKEVGAAIDSIADSTGGDRTKAAAEFLRNLGIAADENTIKVLAGAAAQAKAAKAVEEYIKINDIKNNSDAQQKENVKNLTNELIDQAKAEGNLQYIYKVAVTGVMQRVVDQARYEAEALELLSSWAQVAADKTAALEATQRSFAAAAQLAAFAAETLAAAISRGSQPQFDAIDSQIQSLEDSGPSARTKALEAKIEAASGGGGGGSSRNKELANIEEERQIILLRQKLRLLGANIDLEKYSGKFLLEAIKAKQAALQKEANAQDRLNRLLDLQYKMSQKLRRNEGETISEFLERRAQENRGFLEEQRDIEREKVEERLQELENKTQDEVALQELAERKKNALVKTGSDTRIKSLQKELEASRKRDREALQSRIEALRKEAEKLREGRDNAIKYADQEATQKVIIAINASKKVQDLAKIGGQIAGLNSAKAFLTTLLQSGVLTGSEYTNTAAALQRINNTLSYYDKKMDDFATRNGRTIYKKGGLIKLNNASSPFGSNVRFGEEGDEYGLILQHKVAEGIKNDMKGGTGDMTFYLQKGDDWLRDRYEMKRLVKEAVSEALR